jgi:acetylglutamate kinase
LMDEGSIFGGMIPKVTSGFNTLEAGVKKVHIIDGRIKHSLLLEIFTDEGVGTQMVLETEALPGGTRNGMTKKFVQDSALRSNQ